MRSNIACTCPASRRPSPAAMAVSGLTTKQMTVWSGVLRRQTPPAMLAIPPVLLRSRATSGIHRPPLHLRHLLGHEPLLLLRQEGDDRGELVGREVLEGGHRRRR